MITFPSNQMCFVSMAMVIWPNSGTISGDHWLAVAHLTDMKCMNECMANLPNNICA